MDIREESWVHESVIFVWLLVIEVITVIKTSEMRKERF